jgi:uncharacterized protein (TIGR02391 family)
MVLLLKTTPMKLRRACDDGRFAERTVQAIYSSSVLSFDAWEDIEIGDQLSYELPNGKTKTMEITELDAPPPAPTRSSLSPNRIYGHYRVVDTNAAPRRLKAMTLPGMHAQISAVSGTQFASGHYDEAVFNALKAVEDRFQQLTGSPKGQSGSTLIGKNLMSKVFDEKSPLLDITSDIANEEQKKDQREGYKFLFMGAALGLRNTRGHGGPLHTQEEEALEMLSLASLLMRRLDEGEKRLPQPRHKQPIQKLPPGIGGAVSRS